MYSPFPSGHFFSNKWTSSFCQIAPFLAENDISRCLKGKTVYIMGDSTSRQWIEYLESHLKGLKFTKQADSYVSLLAVDAPNNITVHWKKHAHPWISYNVVNMKKTHFISEVLDSIEVGGEGEDVIVVIGIGQHFRPYPLQFFVSRLLSIRRAILRLQTRSPKAHVIIKLENTRELTSMMIQFSDWYGHTQNLAQRKVFQDLKVVLVDAWDMSVAAKSFAIHPNRIIVSNEVAVA
ncbi:hypothetical protein JZ751_000468, partial [Albula glossodonta]